jgi:hypothetical protein
MGGRVLGNMMDELTVTGTEETPEEVAGRYQPLFDETASTRCPDGPDYEG